MMIVCAVVRARACLALFALLVAAPAAAQSASRWFLAEGASNAVLEQEILVANPGTADLQVTVRLLPDGAAIVSGDTQKVFSLRATSRLTVRLSQDFPGLNGAASAEVSAVVAGTGTPADIVVERTMYFPDGTRAGAHNASGITQARPRWILAEGASGAFSTFILVVNPNPKATTVRVRYLKSTGQVVTFDAAIAANSRRTFWPQSDLPAEMATAEFSTVVESLDATAPIVAERAMYFDPAPTGSRFARSGHDALGVPDPSTTWYFAEGFTGGNPQTAFETFLLLANTNAAAVTATVTYQLDSGGTVVRDYPLNPNQRLTVWVDQEGRSVDARLRAAAFGITVQASAPIVAERAMYWGTPSGNDPTTPTFPWVEGHATAGSPVRAARWGFAEGAQDFLDASGRQYQTFLLFSNPNPTAIAVRATYLRTDGTGIQRSVCVPAGGRANLWSILYPELSNQRFGAFVESVATVAGAVCPTATGGGETYVAERAMYWGAGYSGGHVNMGVPWTAAIGVPPPPTMSYTVTGLSLESTPGSRTGRLSGGEYVTITGTNFTTGTRVFFGDREGAVGFGANPTTTLRVLTPGPVGGRYGSARTVPVTVRRDATSVSAGDFAFAFRVLAIGDSFTEGQLVERIPPVPPSTTPTQFYSFASPPYPEGLAKLLRGDSQYGGSADVDNEGYSGECASLRGCSGNPTSGASRIEGLVAARTFDAVIIIEGFNDLNAGGSVGGAVNALRYMAQTARASGATPVLGILDGPMSGALGDAIRAMADQGGFARHNFRNVELGTDGIHPTQDGYDEMAGQAFTKLKAMFLP
jgi:lysophospholipase L1-like esterase